MKTFFLSFTMLFAFGAAQAQNASSVASARADLELSEVVGVTLISPTGGGGAGGTSIVDLPVNGATAMTNGVESPDIEVSLQGTTNFEISVAASSSTFSYSGTATQNNTMNVADVLKIVVTENSTGGQVVNGFSSYQAVDGTNTKKIIDQGMPGQRSFSFKYKATPGFEYAAGTYTTNVVYTITKL